MRTVGYSVSVLSLIGMLFGAANFFYSKNAWADDVNQQFSELKQQIHNKEKRELQDKIFEKSFLIENGAAKPIDKALKQRYELQLEDMNKTGVDNGE